MEQTKQGTETKMTKDLNTEYVYTQGNDEQLVLMKQHRYIDIMDRSETRRETMGRSVGRSVGRAVGRGVLQNTYICMTSGDQTGIYMEWH